MSKSALKHSGSHRKGRVRDPFWTGFLIGLSGPATMLVCPHRRANLNRVSVENAWNSVGNYIRHGIETERSHVNETNPGRRERSQ